MVGYEGVSVSGVKIHLVTFLISEFDGRSGLVAL